VQKVLDTFYLLEFCNSSYVVITTDFIIKGCINRYLQDDWWYWSWTF